jgi:hypothetical protein
MRPPFKHYESPKWRDHIKIHAELAEFHNCFNLFLKELNSNVNFFTFEHFIYDKLTDNGLQMILKSYILKLNIEFTQIPNIDFTLIIPYQNHKMNQLILKIYIGIRKQTNENNDIAVPFVVPKYWESISITVPSVISLDWESISITNDLQIIEIKIFFFVNFLNSLYFYSFTSFNSFNIEIHNKYKKLFPSAIFKQIYNDYTNRDFLEDY